MHSVDLFTLPLSDPMMIFLALVATVFIVPFLCRKLGFPEIVGLIAAGVLLGPHVLRVLEQDRIVELFGVVGIILLMFIAGLEIDAADFRRYRGRSFFFGFLTFTIPMLLGTAAGLWVLRMETAAAVLLASMFASHTLLSYPLASRLRITGDEAVGVTVGGTIITDIAALMVLAVVVAAHGGNLSPAMGILMGLSLAALVVFTLGLLPPAAAAIYDRLEKSGDLQFLFTLVVLFLCAVLAELAGVEPIIGAFLAGIAVGRHIPPISPLANRIEFFGNAVFIPTFLISVGMRVDPKAFISDGESLMVSAVMVVCVTAAKWAAAFIVQKTSGWSSSRRSVVFGLSVTQAAATLAAVLVGHRVGIFGDAVLNGTIVMILATVILGAVAVQSGGSRMAAEAPPASRGRGKRRILLGVAKEESAERLLDLALLLEDGEGTPEIRGVSVVPPAAISDETAAEVEKRLRPLTEKAAAAGSFLDGATRVDQEAARGLANAAREYRASDILIGWRRRNSFFDRGTRDIMEALEALSPERIMAARLSGPLGTLRMVELLLPGGVETDEDFRGCILICKLLARRVQGTLRCVGRRPALDRVRELMDEEPSFTGIAYIETKTGTAAAAASAERLLTVAVLPRRNTSSWTEETAALTAMIDKKLTDRDVLALFPRSAVPTGETPQQTGLMGILSRLASKMPAGSFWSKGAS